MRNRNIVGIALLTLLVLYIGSYIGLSVGGRYEPEAIGGNGVKWYAWAPCGFVTDYKRNRLPGTVYYPLHYLDMWLWHTGEKADSGRYPVNEVKGEDVWKVYKAWGFSLPRVAVLPKGMAMARRVEEEAEWNDEGWQGDESIESSDEEDESTVPCPYCRREIYEDSVRCPHCGQYLSDEDVSPSRKPWWIIVGALLCLLVVWLWIATLQ